MSKKELRGEQIRDMLMNGTTSLFPGGAFLKDVLDFRQDLKQRRIIKFLDSFLEELNEITSKSEGDILDACTTEEFIDIFDSVIEKIQQTKSEQKAKRFSDLLIKQTIEPFPDYFMLKVIDILHSLNDVQIHMLDKLRFSEHFGVSNSNTFYDIFGKSVQNENGFYNISLTDKVVVKVSKVELELYFNDLVSLGFIKHEVRNELKHPGKYKPIDARPSLKTKEKFYISKSGKSFIDLFTSNQTY